MARKATKTFRNGRGQLENPATSGWTKGVRVCSYTICKARERGSANSELGTNCILFCCEGEGESQSLDWRTVI